MIQRFKIGDIVRITPDVARAHFSCPHCDKFKVIAVIPLYIDMARYEIEHVTNKTRRTIFDDGLVFDQIPLEWGLTQNVQK